MMTLWRSGSLLAALAMVLAGCSQGSNPTSQAASKTAPDQHAVNTRSNSSQYVLTIDGMT